MIGNNISELCQVKAAASGDYAQVNRAEKMEPVRVLGI